MTAPRRPTSARRSATAYAVEGDAVDLGLGVYDGAVVREGDRAAADGDDEPPRPDRGRHRHRQDPHAAADRRAALRRRRLGVRRRLQGRPVGARATRAPQTGRRRSGWPISGCRTSRPRYPVEFLSLGGIGDGVPVRATVTDFGPELLGKVLGANETQEQSLALLFRFADERGLGLVDLADLRALLTYLGSDAGQAGPDRDRRRRKPDDRGAAALARRARGRRRHRVLRRAAARDRRPDPDARRTAAG